MAKYRKFIDDPRETEEWWWGGTSSRFDHTQERNEDDEDLRDMYN